MQLTHVCKDAPADAPNWETKYRDFYESIKEGIVLIDPEGHFVECNPAYEEMLGYNLEELKTLTYMDLTPEKWHTVEAKIVKTQVKVQGYSDEYEKEYIRKDGTVFPVSIRIYSNPDLQGRIEREWAVVRDITEEKRAEQVLRTANEVLNMALQAREEMVQNVSHELRTPLTHIQGNAEMLLQGMLGDLNSEQLEAMTVILDKTVHLSHLVNDLLSLRTPESGDEQGFYQSVNLLELVTQGVAQAQQYAAHNGIILSLNVGVAHAQVYGASRHLQQVLDNLLSNAFKFTPTGGYVQVALTAEDDWYTLTVADSGPGVPATDLERIFDRFYQVDGSRTRRHGGMGLGLSIARQLVQAHGGRIWCESVYGDGATFHVWLPRMPLGT